LAAKKPALGRGLGALIPDIGIENNEGVTEIDINDIEPNKDQPRRKFDEDKLRELADSIKEHGVVQPVIVKKEGSFYKLIAGERRWRAARIAGLKTIPAITKEFTEQEIMEISLIENVQREDLNPIEEAEAYKRLIDEFKLTQEEISQKIGKSRSAIANILRLASLDERVKQYVSEGILSEGHARALSNVDDNKELQYEIAKRVINENLNVRQTEKLIKKKMLEAIKNPFDKKGPDPYLGEVERRIENVLGAKVSVKFKRRKGTIQIDYYSQEDLERILEILKA
jgi:ParB family chromosome partitioning protein